MFSFEEVDTPDAATARVASVTDFRKELAARQGGEEFIMPHLTRTAVREATRDIYRKETLRFGPPALKLKPY